MFSAPRPQFRFSLLRIGMAGLLLLVSLAVSIAPRPTAVKADTGEAAYGTPTQALQAAISLGNNHTCVIKNTNLLCWGSNEWGKLGIGSVDSNRHPTPAYVLDRAGSTDLLSGVIGVIASENHTCALLNTTKVKCWGYSWRIGKFSSSGFASTYPTFVKSLYTNQTESDASADLTGAVALSATAYNTCAVINDGRVKCWGDSTGGGKVGSGVGYVLMCTNNSYSSSCGSGETSNVQLTGVKQLSMNGQTACAIKNDESQVCWGTTNGVYGYAGSDPPGTRMYASSADPSTTGAKAISPSSYSACGLFEKAAGQAVGVSGGQVKCWGKNSEGALGRDAASVLPQDLVTNYVAGNVPGMDTALAISGEMQTFCGLLFDRTVKCWGSNPNGKVSVGQVGASGLPRLMRTGNISSAVITDIYAVSVGGDHVCIVIGLTGNVKCSGSNSNGQLGDGTVTASAVNMTTVTDTTGSGSLTGAGADNMPPTYSSSVVNTTGTKVILTYNEVLSAAGSIPTSAFVVKVGGVTRTISSVNVDGLTVELNMAERIAPGEVVRMSYTDPTTNVDDSNVIEDSSFNDSSSIPEAQITNNSNTEAVAPTLVSAAVNAAGTSLTLTYNEALGSTTASVGAFVVTVGGVTRTITGVTVSGSTVVLTLASAVLAGATVTVAYTAPTSDLGTTNNAVQDIAGNDAASFSSGAVDVTNGSTFDNVAPLFVSGAVSGDKTKVVLTYNEALGSTTASIGAFVVKVNASTRTITAVAVSGSTVELTLASSVSPGDTVTVQYTAPTASALTTNNAIQDTSGNDAASIAADSSVANVTDVTAPTFVSSAVNTGGSLVLTYSESLSATAPGTSAIGVTINGTSVTVVSVSIVGSTVVVVTSPVIQRGDAVTFSYTDPTAGNDVNAIQDSAGNDTASTSGSISVPSGSNASTVDTTGPAFVSGAVNTAGSLVVTYNETLAAPGPGTSAIAVTINGSSVTVVSVSLVGSTVVVVTSPVIGIGDVVTYRYTDPTSGNDPNAIQDALGNDAISSSSAYTVPSGSNGSTIDTDPPGGVTIGVDGGGTRITLTFDEALSPTGPSRTNFTVTVDGVEYTVTNLEISGRDAILTVSPAIRTGQSVVVSYRDPTSGNDANALQDAAGNDIPSFGNVNSTNRSTQVSATNQVNQVVDSTLPVDKPTSGAVDGDASSTSTSLSETVALKGKSGKATFADGSTMDVSKNGNLIPRLFTAYTGTVTGSVKVSYKVGKKTVSVTCSYGKYGTTKPKKVTKSQNGWFPKAYISPTKKCLMPPAAVKALNTQLVTIAAKLKFVRLWPTTGKAVNPESGAAIRPVNRAYSVKIGTEPK